MEVPALAKITEYLETVRDQIRWKRARFPLTQELETHLLEQKADFLADGMDEEGLLTLAACLEGPSEHPLASAIVEESRGRNLPITSVGGFEAVHGS